jgi:hypothetical protein
LLSIQKSCALWFLSQGSLFDPHDFAGRDTCLSCQAICARFTCCCLCKGTTCIYYVCNDMRRFLHDQSLPHFSAHLRYPEAFVFFYTFPQCSMSDRHPTIPYSMWILVQAEPAQLNLQRHNGKGQDRTRIHYSKYMQACIRLLGRGEGVFLRRRTPIIPDKKVLLGSRKL